MPFADKERRRAYAKAYRLENKERQRKLERAWRKANPDKANAIQRRWWQKYKVSHPERVEANRERLRKWIVDNPERFRERKRIVKSRRRARIRGVAIGEIDFEQLIIDSCGFCGICQKSLADPIEFDHIIPISRGGSHTQDNIQPTHATCNAKKSSKLPSELCLT